MWSGLDAVDVGRAAIQALYLCRVDIEAGNAEALFAEQQGQRQAHIAEADDADPRRTAFHCLQPAQFELAGTVRV